jgi:signal transduction histidine kinase
VISILNQVLNQESINAEQKQIELKSEIEGLVPSLKGKNEDFEKIFRNLINNAVRYTPEGGRISISASYEPHTFTFKVEDTGIGISEPDLPKIFDEFYRSENAKKVENIGTGLGLSLVKQLVEKYSGTVEVDSVLNQGTTFLITVPVRVNV